MVCQCSIHNGEHCCILRNKVYQVHPYNTHPQGPSQSNSEQTSNFSLLVTPAASEPFFSPSHTLAVCQSNSEQTSNFSLLVTPTSSVPFFSPSHNFWSACLPCTRRLNKPWQVDTRVYASADSEGLKKSRILQRYPSHGFTNQCVSRKPVAPSKFLCSSSQKLPTIPCINLNSTGEQSCQCQVPVMRNSLLQNTCISFLHSSSYLKLSVKHTAFPWYVPVSKPWPTEIIWIIDEQDGPECVLLFVCVCVCLFLTECVRVCVCMPVFFLTECHM